MSTISIEFDGVEGLYVLEALAAKSAQNHNRITRMIEQGATPEQFEMSVAMSAAIYIDAAHRRVQAALFGVDETVCEHEAGLSDCSNCGWMAELV